MISRLVGIYALSGVGFANQISYFIIFIFTAFNVGAVAMIARYHGEKNYAKLKSVVSSNLVINTILGSLAAFALYRYSSYFFDFYELDPRSLNFASNYIGVLAFSMPGLFVVFCGAATFRGVQQTRTPMILSFIFNIVNIVLNYLLITGWGIFPEMGVEGAALATVIARSLSALTYIYFFFIHNNIDFLLKLKDLFKIDWKQIKTLARLSSLGALEQFIFQSTFLLLGIFVAKLTNLDEAAFRILVSLESLSFLPAIGMAIATGAMLGDHLGNKNVKAAFEVGWCSFILVFIWGLFALGIFFIFGEAMLLVFVSKEDIELFNYAKPLVPLLAWNQPGLALVITLGGAIRGAGAIRDVLIFTVIRMWLFLIPSSYWMITKTSTGLAGLWYAEIAVFVASAIAMIWYFAKGKWVILELK